MMDLVMRLCRQPKVTLEEAYAAGVDCAKHGPNLINCHYSLFATPELTKEWERGYATRLEE